MKKHALVFFGLLLIVACKDSETKPEHIDVAGNSTEFSNPPAWSKNVIWYEIAVERFRNGDKTNDPTAEDIIGTFPGKIPDSWKITPWTQDWYKADPFFSELDGRKDFYGNPTHKFVDKVQMRRYGGDLQGVLDKIDYIDSLGITAIYFRPLNDSPSLHKYDARNWRHIDVNFGPDPEGDKKIMASEIPDDPSTWQMTSADQLFLKVIKAFHERGIRVILDYSWNHTGNTFWAWKDVLKHQENSKFKDWYWVEHFDDPKTEENEFKYHGWVGVHTLPEIRETQKQDASISLTSFEGNIYDASAKQHIFNVASRWLDPNQDGDVSDGVDGYRLDVAAETPLGFWRDFRKHVRNINPDAYLLGEIWWEQWPDKLLDPEPFLRGDIFDAVMNYRWYRATRHYLNKSPNEISVNQYIDSLNFFRSNLRKPNNYAMMNYTGGFDTPRVLTSLFNKNKYKYYCKVHENPEYKIHKPDANTYQILKLLLVQQYTYIGSPHIYAGDEMGMWGADDPSCRKPLIWPDYTFEDETAHPFDQKRPVDEVVFNNDLFNYHQKLIEIRKAHPVLAYGEIEFLSISDSDKVLAYSRYDENNEVITIINSDDKTINVSVKVKFSGPYVDVLNNADVKQDNKAIKLKIEPKASVLIKSN
ncbi:glycoside hydrolase family 13 protein [Winogradskyella sp.]|uniref:glycoside hydrolase family 13 protein n=1 Tax=Winogradskyella sp. TaxID=1883156 RepID=UPI00262E7597|nr:glycoside hydrolase family 13 protein [Winogradskyella sp.]